MTAIAALLVGPSVPVVGLEVRADLVQYGRANVRAVLDAPARAAALTEDDVAALRAIEFEHRNCFVPDPEDRHFDRIHIGASCPVGYLPQILQLLTVGGIAVLPCGACHSAPRDA